MIWKYHFSTYSFKEHVPNVYDDIRYIEMVFLFVFTINYVIDEIDSSECDTIHNG